MWNNEEIIEPNKVYILTELNDGGTFTSSYDPVGFTYSESETKKWTKEKSFRKYYELKKYE
jgi:hypothetical protein